MPAGSNPLGTNGAINGHLEGESYAGFGQIDWAFADNWTFTLGARYTEDKKKGFDEAFYIGTHPVHCDRRGGSEPSRARYGSSSRPNPALAAFAGLATADDATLRAALNNPAFAALISGTAAGVLAVTQGLALDITQAGTGCVGCVPGPNGGLRRNLEGE